MAPKASKAQQEKIAVDKTFGMKNKNKSKVVQKYIKSITANVTGRSTKAEQDERKAKEDKEKTIQQKALMASLFNQAVDKKGRQFDPVAKKAAKQAEEEALAAGRKLSDQTRKALIEGIANTIRLTNPKQGIRMSEMGGHPIIQALKEAHADVFKTISLLLFIKANRLVFWVDDPDSSNPTIRCQEDVEAEVAPDERCLEEILEERRRALPPGGTPVTAETFKAWKERKLAESIEEKRLAGLQAGKKAGVGMSGKDLFTFDASVFVDDEDAVDANEYDERSSVHSDDDAPKALSPKHAVAEGAGEDEEDEEADGDGENEGEGEGAGEDGAEDEDEEQAENENDGEADGETVGATGASGADSSKPVEVVINKELFLQGGDDLDDLDDLDD